MTESLEPNTLRLNKHLALQLGVSRREADELIDGRYVTINGTVATLGARFKEGDEIIVNGKTLTDSTEYQYLAFNKPVGYVCSRRAQGDNPTIYELIPEQYHVLKPVGRLDKDSSGIILLTNDGDFAYQMTHPKFAKAKTYQARLDRDLEPLHQQMISDYGVQLEDGTSKLLLERLSETNRKEWQIVMKEGRNRQIRRTFGSLGYTVVKLHRTQFGDYNVGDLKSGAFVDVKNEKNRSN
jgi:23S rRNA pseudouridine2605 synthase